MPCTERRIYAEHFVRGRQTCAIEGTMIRQRVVVGGVRSRAEGDIDQARVAEEAGNLEVVRSSGFVDFPSH